MLCDRFCNVLETPSSYSHTICIITRKMIKRLQKFGAFSQRGLQTTFNAFHHPHFSNEQNFKFFEIL